VSLWALNIYFLKKIMTISLSQLQSYIKNKDHNPELKHAYFLKLVEEVGELSDIIRKIDFKNIKAKYSDTGNIKGTLDEELYDCLYYILALSNIYDVDLTQAFFLKEDYNQSRLDH
jgi:NTP pyrophosphatase (non-canonical NTP hydrolase)